MNRLEKKCFIASTGTHLALIAVLTVSSAFRSRDDKPIKPPVTVIDGAKLAAIMNAGAAAAQPPALRPPDPEPVARPEPPKPRPKQPERKPDPKPEPKPQPKPEPKPVVKPTPKPIPKPPTPTPKPRPKPEPKRKVEIASLDKLITRTDTAAEKRRREAEEKRRRDAEREAEAKRQRMVDNVLGGVRFSSTVSVRAPAGSSQATMDYGSYVRQTYDQQWREPSQLAGSRHSADVTVTIRKDGSVASARLSRRSGVGALDSSIQGLIDKVRRFKPFPAGMDESSATYTIEFSVSAK